MAIRSLPRWSLAALVVAGAVSAGIAASPRQSQGGTTLERAPQLVGLTANVAVQRLRALGLNYEFETSPVPRLGTIVAQEPAPGTSVGVDQKIYVVVRPNPSVKVSVAILLDRTTVLPGPIDRGVAVIINNSGHALHIRDCRNRGGLVAGLTSSRVAYLTGPPLLDCHLIRGIGPGATTLHTWIQTTYQNCDTPQTPKCTDVGLADLPAGTYSVRFPLAGLPPATIISAPSVTVLPPAWLTSLSDSQGSLLVAASPCVAEAQIPSPPPKTTVVVTRSGHVVATRSVAFPGGTFTLALAPGRYVVRNGPYRRAVVRILPRRQSIGDVRANCI